MILLSCPGWPPAAIAELLGCDPATVRRRNHRHNQHGVTGLSDGPGRDQTLATPRQTIAELPRGTVVLADDEIHVNLLPWVRTT